MENPNIVDKENKQYTQVKEELELVKKQRDVALGKLNKSLQIAKQLRDIIENGQKK